MAHTCKAAILHCIDFRLGQSIKKYLSDNELLGDCDIISIAGATKEFEFPMAQIELSHKLHSISKVILMNHTDCGAYGGRSAFDSDDAESETHFNAMNKAKDSLLEKYPDLEVLTILARIGEDGSVTFEEK